MTNILTKSLLSTPSSTSFMKQKHSNNPTSFKTDTKLFQEYCTIIDSIQCKEIKKQIYTMMDTMVNQWECRHESLINLLNEYENAYDKLQNDYQIQKMKYDSTIQEMRFYKLKYESSSMMQLNNNEDEEIEENNAFHHLLKKDRYSYQSLNSSSRNSTITSNSSIDSLGRFSKSSYYSAPLDHYRHPRSSTSSFNNTSIKDPISPIPNHSLGSPLFYNHNNDNNSSTNISTITTTTTTNNNNEDNDDQLDISPILSNYPSLDTIPLQKSPPPDDLPLPPLPSSIPTSPSMVNNDHQKKISSINNSIENNNNYINNDTVNNSTSASLSLSSSNNTTPCSSKSHLNSPTDLQSTIETIITTTTTINNNSNNDKLEFGCGDGFWHTIARGRSDKEGVDVLVANYLKRGGKTNVANHTSSVKLVKEGYGLVHALIAIRNTAALKRIISIGINPHVLPITECDQDKFSPLVLASKLNYYNGVRLLIERAFTNILESKGPFQESALHATAENDAIEIATYLIHACPHGLIDQVDINGATPLHYASKSGKIKMMTYLINTCGISPNKTDHLGETPLHYAIRNRQGKAVVKLVSEFGANPNVYILKQVPTPLDLAKSGGLRSISDYLRKMGAKTVKEMEKFNHNHQRQKSNLTSTSSILSSSNCSTLSDKTSTSDGSSSSLSNKSFVLGATSIMKSKLEELVSK